MSIIFLFCFLTLRLSAPSNHIIYIIKSEAIMPYEAIIRAVTTVESAGDMYALNRQESAYGALQIRQIKLDWYYNETGIRYRLNDCFKESVSREIFVYHMNQYSDVDTGIKKWNGSGRKTNEYLIKVQKVIDCFNHK